MRNSVLLGLVLLLNIQAFGQGTTDSLTYKRHVFSSTVFLNGVKQPNKKLLNVYKKAHVFESERLLHRSKTLLPIGAVTAVAGLGLSIDALVGTKQTVTIDNVEYTYYKRPILQLISGIGLLAAGIGVMEFSNDFRVKSVQAYNKKIKDNTVKTSVGFLPSGKIGVRLDF